MRNKSRNQLTTMPVRQGLYDPAFEKDSCGVGFVANIKGVASHQSWRMLITSTPVWIIGEVADLKKTPVTGAGILTALPHSFLRKVTKELGITLPPPGSYAAGNIFLPQLDDERGICKDTIERIITERGSKVSRLAQITPGTGFGRNWTCSKNCNARHRTIVYRILPG